MWKTSPYLSDTLISLHTLSCLLHHLCTYIRTYPVPVSYACFSHQSFFSWLDQPNLHTIAPHQPHSQKPRLSTQLLLFCCRVAANSFQILFVGKRNSNPLEFSTATSRHCIRSADIVLHYGWNLPQKEKDCGLVLDNKVIDRVAEPSGVTAV